MGRLDTDSTKGKAVMPLALQIGFFAWVSAVVAGTFLYVPPASGFAVPEAARMVVLHVPCAIVSVLAYVISTVYAIAYLGKQRADLDTKSAASASIGFVFTVLTTVTGMIFAKIQWGAAWNWDPRETSIFMLLIVYAAYFALRGSIPGVAARARISAVYNTLACVAMPFLVFVIPRVMGGLHPSTTLSDRGSLSPEYRIAMACAMVGYVWLYVWLFRILVRGAWRRGK